METYIELQILGTTVCSLHSNVYFANWYVLWFFCAGRKLIASNESVVAFVVIVFNNGLIISKSGSKYLHCKQHKINKRINLTTQFLITLPLQNTISEPLRLNQHFRQRETIIYLNTVSTETTAPPFSSRNTSVLLRRDEGINQQVKTYCKLDRDRPSQHEDFSWIANRSTCSFVHQLQRKNSII